MTDEQRDFVDDLIRVASEPIALSDYEVDDMCAAYLADIRRSSLAIAIMLRELLEKPQAPEPFGLQSTLVEDAIIRRCDPPTHRWTKGYDGCYCGFYKRG